MFISDTHGQHDALLLPRGDMIVHAGDVTKGGTAGEVRDFLQWFSHLNYKHKIFIAGAHDHLFEEDPGMVRRMMPSNVVYLEESGVEIGGLKIWGSPYNPHRSGNAFTRMKEEINGHWNKIPEDSNMVIMHTPAYGVLDENANGEHEGSKELLRRLVRVEPTYFVCGHRHGERSYEYHYGIHFINASLANTENEIIHKPVFQWYP